MPRGLPTISPLCGSTCARLEPEITGCAFQAVLHNLDEPGNTIEPGDRLWLLPEGLVPGADLPEHVLASLAAVVRAGGKIVVMADDAEVGNWACEAIERALVARQGSA